MEKWYALHAYVGKRVAAVFANGARRSAGGHLLPLNQFSLGSFVRAGETPMGGSLMASRRLISKRLRRLRHLRHPRRLHHQRHQQVQMISSHFSPLHSADFRSQVILGVASFSNAACIAL